MRFFWHVEPKLQSVAWDSQGYRVLNCDAVCAWHFPRSDPVWEQPAQVLYTLLLESYGRCAMRARGNKRQRRAGWTGSCPPFGNCQPGIIRGVSLNQRRKVYSFLLFSCTHCCKADSTHAAQHIQGCDALPEQPDIWVHIHTEPSGDGMGYRLQHQTTCLKNQLNHVTGATVTL